MKKRKVKPEGSGHHLLSVLLTVPMTGTSYVIMQDIKTSKRYFVVSNINGGTEIQPLD